jgi:hypothetical protein
MVTKCPACGKQFGSWQGMKSHYWMIHLGGRELIQKRRRMRYAGKILTKPLDSFKSEP